MFCAFCGAGHGVLGDTGGTEQSLTSEEAVLLDSLAFTTRGSYGAARLRPRKVAKAEFTPLDALTLAEAAADTYPSGVVVIHLARIVRVRIYRWGSTHSSWVCCQPSAIATERRCSGRARRESVRITSREAPSTIAEALGLMFVHIRSCLCSRQTPSMTGFFLTGKSRFPRQGSCSTVAATGE